MIEMLATPKHVRKTITSITVTMEKYNQISK